jgi:transcriptional regulator with XRE-family HTH domain
MTQEKLAEYLGVSCQAVSKWESENGYPDIELLPALANFFNVSSDELLGIEISRNKEIVRDYIKRFRELSDDATGQLALMRGAIAKFPSNYSILQHLMYALIANIKLPLKPNNAVDGIVIGLRALSENPDYDGITTKATALENDANRSLLAEAIAIAERILEDCTEDAIRQSAIQVLCYYYPLIGKKEQALLLAKSIPSLFMCREFLREEIYSGEDKIKQIQACICLLTDYLCNAICAVADPDLQQKNINSLGDKIHLFELANRIYQLVFENGDYGVYHNRLAFNYRIMAALALLNGQRENALSDLENAMAHAIAADTLPEITAFTSPAVNRLSYDERFMDEDLQSPDFMFHQKIVRDRIVLKMEETNANQCVILLRKLEHIRYDAIRDTDRFRAVVDTLTRYAKSAM